MDQAMSEVRKAFELDPLSLHTNFNAGWIYWCANRLDDAMTQARKMIELEPNFFGAYWLMGALYWLQGKHEEALEAHQKALSLNLHQMILGAIGGIYRALGKRDEAQRVLNQLLEMRKQQSVNALSVVLVYLGLGEIDKVLEWLEIAIEERNGPLAYIETEIEVGSMGVNFEKASKDPRIMELLRREGLIS